MAGWLARAIELGAGPRHFGAFLDFCRRGGLEGLAEEMDLEVRHQERCEGGALLLSELGK